MLLAAALSCLCLPPMVAAGADDAAIRPAARGLVQQLVDGDFTAAVECFDETMKKVLPPNKLRSAWAGQVGQLGGLQQLSIARVEKAGPYSAVFVTCQFEKASFDVKAVFNKQAQIAGLFFVPTLPDYVKQDTFQETEVTIGKGVWKLPATLSMPKGEGKFPAVLLVHGSGPQDRDETIGPNKPFRDIAWGVASRRIAVLRYDKRTHAHKVLAAVTAGTMTVREEAIDDALAAVRALRGMEGIDASRVFVLGHSMGGMLLPRIATRDEAIAGLIFLAGNSRPLTDLMIEQTDYLLSLDGDMPERQRAQLLTLKKNATRVKQRDFDKRTPASELPGGAAAYWLDLQDYDPLQVAAQLPQPMLILQGERDYQVTLADFDGWKRGLKAKQNAVFKRYPKLNHLFIAGSSKSTPAEYALPGHVDRQIIEDLVEWIRGH